MDFAARLIEAQSGNHVAQHDTGVWYLSGEEGAPDVENARKWFLAAAEQGHAPAQAAVAFLHLQGGGDLQQAHEWYTRAARQGDAEGQYGLAEVVASGLTDKADPQQARVLLELAADQGHGDAQCQLAYCLDSGIGGVIDRAAATRWYFEAAAAGVPRGQSAVAGRLHAGNSVPRDDVAAMAWYLRAAAAEYPLATQAIDQLEQSLSQGERRHACALADGEIEIVEPEVARAQSLRDTRCKLLSWSPRVFLIEQLLTRDECCHLIAKARPHMHSSKGSLQHQGPAELTSGGGSNEMQFGLRLCDTVVQHIISRYAEQARLPPAHCEPLMLLEHHRGGGRQRYDSSLEPPRSSVSGERIATIICCLNRVSAGGAIEFAGTELSVDQSPGDAILVYPCCPDGTPDSLCEFIGKPVTAGKKWAAVGWFREHMAQDSVV